MTTDTMNGLPFERKKKKRKHAEIEDESFTESFSVAKKQKLASPGILLSNKKKLKKRKKGISRNVSFNLSKNISKVIDTSHEILEKSRQEAERFKQEQITGENQESNEIVLKKKKKKKKKKEDEEENHELEKVEDKENEVEEAKVGKKSKKKKKKGDDQEESAIKSQENCDANPESKKKKKKKRKEKDENENEVEEVVEEKCDIEPEPKKKKKIKKEKDESLTEENCDINPEKKTKKKKKKDKEKDENLNEVEDKPVEIRSEPAEIKSEPESPDFKDAASSNVNDDLTVKRKKKKKKKDRENEENIVDENGLDDQPTKAKKRRKEDEIDGNEDDVAEPKKKKKKKKDKKEDPEPLPETKSKKKKKHKNEEISTPEVHEIEEVGEVPTERKKKKKKKKEKRHLSDNENTEAGSFNPTVIKPIKEKKKKKKQKPLQDVDSSPMPTPVYTSTPAPSSVNPAFRNLDIEPMNNISRDSDSDSEEIDAHLSQISSIMQEPCTIPANIMNVDDPDDVANSSGDADGTESDSAPRTLISYEDRAKNRDIFGRPIFAKRMAQLPEMTFDFSHLEHCCDYVLHMDWQDSPNAEILHSLPYRRLGKEELEELKSRGITVKRNRWLREEEHRLRMNFKAFVEAHKDEIDFDQNLLAVVPFELRDNDKEEFRRVVKFRKQHNFIRSLALGLERDLDYINKKATNILNRNWNKGRFTPEEERQLQALVAEHGSEQCSHIAQLMGRTPQAIIDKIIYEAQDLRKGKWSMEEDAMLQKAVAAVTKHTNAQPTETGKFPWGTVVDMVPGRNKTQCRNRWFQVLGNDKKSMDKELKMKLLEYLEDLVGDVEEPMDDRAIDWEKAAKEVGFSSQPVCRVAWKKMKAAVATHETDLCLQGLLKRLQRMKPKWRVKSPATINTEVKGEEQPEQQTEERPEEQPEEQQEQQEEEQ